MAFSQETIDKVWKLAKPIPGRDPAEYRYDPYYNIIRYSSYGKDSKMGWEIDHIVPVNCGGSDNIRNLQAMQTEKNRKLGDSLRKRSRHNQ